MHPFTAGNTEALLSKLHVRQDKHHEISQDLFSDWTSNHLRETFHIWVETFLLWLKVYWGQISSKVHTDLWTTVQFKLSVTSSWNANGRNDHMLKLSFWKLYCNLRFVTAYCYMADYNNCDFILLCINMSSTLILSCVNIIKLKPNKKVKMATLFF